MSKEKKDFLSIFLEWGGGGERARRRVGIVDSFILAAEERNRKF